MNGSVLGVDIGGTKIAAALVDDRGRRVSEWVTAPTEGHRGADHVLDRVEAVARRVLSGADRVPALVGVGSAGVFDAEGRVLSATDSLRGWAGTDVRTALHERLGLSVHVLNDVHAFALAESELGAARGAGAVLSVAIGTGVGGAFVDRGLLLTGATGTAGAVGHVDSPSAAGLPCSCGGAGHLEAIAAGPAIERAYARGGGTASPLREIALRAREGDPLASAVFAQAGAALGRALAGLGNVLDPEVIVLGGGVMNVADLLVPPLQRAFVEGALPGPRGAPIVPASFTGDSVVVGAATYARRQAASGR